MTSIVSTKEDQPAITAADNLAKFDIVTAAKAGAIQSSQLPFFAAFDGTNNNLKGSLSGLDNPTNVAKLFRQVKSVEVGNNIFADYL